MQSSNVIRHDTGRDREWSSSMTDTPKAVLDVQQDIQQARKWALVVPREHGAWGLLLIPLFTGVVTGFSPAHRVLPLLGFTLAALSLFWLRTPLESLLGTGTMTAHTPPERRMAFMACAGLAIVAGTCLLSLMWRGQNLDLLLLGIATAFAFAAQATLRKLGRSARMLAQLVGIIGLTCTAPAAYYVATGHLDQRALLLWAANWIFAGNQVHFVQLRIHAARAATFAERFSRGRLFFLAQPVLLAVLIAASLWRLTPALMILAFCPALIRGTRWFFKAPEPLNVRGLGWSEMRQGVIFGLLLAVALTIS
jgi:hypothetical protein